MKSILLTTTALVAFAGAAVAEVTFYGDATLGYNYDSDFTPLAGDDFIGDYEGFYWEGTLGVIMTQELDNGVTAGAQLEIDVVDTNNSEDLVSGDFVLSLTTETAGLYLGDTAFAAETHWASAGDMEADGFSEADGEVALRGDISYGDVDASVSYVIANNDGTTNVSEDLNQLSIGVSGSFANFGYAVAYQAESDEGDSFYSNDPVYVPVGTETPGDNGDFSDSEIFGVSVNTTFSGATVTLAYASNETADENSLGVQVAYPFGPVTATVYYVAEDDGGDEDNYGVTLAYAAEGNPLAVTLDYDYDQGVNKIGLDGSYDLGNGLTLLAGVFDQSDDATEANNGTDFYVAGVYDLGNGAELLISYADAETGDAFADDEVGAPDYQVGTTVEVSFEF